jgi:tetratricopeptide (TPR) repeat protein
MHRALFGFLVLGGLLLAFTAAGQTQQQINWCYANDATDDQTIEGCTAMIQSGRYSGADLADAYNNLASGYHGKGQIDLAIQNDLIAIQLNPRNAQAFNNLGVDYREKGNYDQAMADYTQAIALKPDYANAYAGRGDVYSRQGQRDAAIADFRTALRYNPSQATALAGLRNLGLTP